MEFPNLTKVRAIGLDYETTGLKYWLSDFRVLGIGIATADASWYFDIRQRPSVVKWLQDVLPYKLIIAHNAQFEYQVTRVLGMEPRDMRWYCTMIAECLIDENQFEYNLEAVASRNLVKSDKKVHLDLMQAAMGAKNHDAVLANLANAPPELVAKYGAGDARDCYDIWLAQAPAIKEQALDRVLAVEMELLPVLADASWVGVRVDLEKAHDTIPLLDKAEIELSVGIKDLTGCKDPSVFVNSPKQMREFFKPEKIAPFQWRLIDGTIVGPTKKGESPSLGQDALRQMRHPVATNILGLRKTIKLRDTFVRGHVIASADSNAYVHTTFNQTRTDQDVGTVTGRLSATDPALHQISKRDKKYAEMLRALFLADVGEQWLTADFRQVDFRCAADLMQDQRLIAEYWATPELDYHQAISDMTGIPRNPAYAGAPNTKTINLGLSFGAGPGKLAAMMGMEYTVYESRGRMAFAPGDKAREIFNQYHRRLPNVNKFMEYAQSVAKTRGYVKTRLGRRLRFPRYGQHKAAGYLFQAYAADLHKVALIETDQYLRSEHAGRLLVSVHDEIGVSLPENTKHIPGIVAAYTNFNSESSRIRMKVPILASSSIGPNWWEASK